MKPLKLIGLLIFIVSLASCSQTTNKNDKSDIPANWETLDEANYMIQYPDSFELNTSGQMGMSFILLSKKTSPQDEFRENVNLVIQDLAGQNIDLDKYVEISESQIKSMIINSDIIESKRVKTGNLASQKVIFTGFQGQFNIKFEQHYWIVNNKAYVLTFTAEVNEFDNYKDVSEKIMNSFRIK